MAAIKYWQLAGYFFLLHTLQAQVATNNHFPAIIPIPVEVKQTTDVFTVSSSSVISCKDAGLLKNASLLQLYLSAYGIINTVVSNINPTTNYIELNTDSNAITQTEGYRLIVTNQSIKITGHNAAGVVYAIETLRQLWKKKSTIAVTVPGCVINDYPRFAYRGMALDVSRHLFPVLFIKKYIDLLALYKFNIFHWHLTDDQGWRIEIKKYPKLQSISAWRTETLIGHKKEIPHRFDGKRYGGYYTQQEIKEIVAYATQRNITIIPEIEMPGHAVAALAAYPQFGCTGGPYKTATFWGIFDDVFCAGNDSSFLFLQEVIDEVVQLFPSNYIHIGGDECPKTKWKSCVKCQQRIKDLQLKDEHALQSYFIERMEKYINSKGKKIIGWDEILEGGLAPNATVMSWQGEEGGIAAAKQKHEVIMTPESHFYFDYYQSLYEEEPLAAAGYTALQKVYGYEPLGDKISTDEQQFIRGIEGQAWSEYFASEAKAMYMIFPRALAVAEVAWALPQKRNYTDFLNRLRKQKPLLQHLNVTYANNFDEIQSTSTVTEAKLIEVKLQTSLPNSTIRFTIDGTEPLVNTKLYQSSVLLTKSCMLKARLFNEHQQAVGREFKQQFILHKATGKPVNLLTAPIARFNTNSSALVNGLYGNSRYNNGNWMGFSGDNMEAVIDMGTIEPVGSVSMNFLNYHWQRMWAPVSVIIYTSADSVLFTKVFSQKNVEVNGINNCKAVLQQVRARYIKIVAINKGVIPQGEYGAGSKALLLVDEIVVN